MTKDDQRGGAGAGIQAREFGRHASHGDQFGAFHPRELKLGRFADIDQRKIFAGGDAALDLLGRDFEREFGEREFGHRNNRWSHTTGFGAPARSWRLKSTFIAKQLAFYGASLFSNR